MPPLPASDQRPLSPLVGKPEIWGSTIEPTGVQRSQEFGASAASPHSRQLVRELAERRRTRPCEALRHAYHAKRRVFFDSVVFLALTRVLPIHWHVSMAADCADCSSECT